jgi:hypothetical protein
MRPRTVQSASLEISDRASKSEETHRGVGVRGVRRSARRCVSSELPAVIDVTQIQNPWFDPVFRRAEKIIVVAS